MTVSAFDLLKPSGQVSLPELTRLADRVQQQDHLTMPSGEWMKTSAGMLIAPPGAGATGITLKWVFLIAVVSKPSDVTARYSYSNAVLNNTGQFSTPPTYPNQPDGQNAYHPNDNTHLLDDPNPIPVGAATFVLAALAPHPAVPSAFVIVNWWSGLTLRNDVTVVNAISNAQGTVSATTVTETFVDGQFLFAQ